MQTQIINVSKVLSERKAAALRNARAEINAIATRNIIQMQLEGIALQIDATGWHVSFR